MIPKILQSTDAHAPLSRITSFEDFKTLLKALLVTGIPEAGGSAGWSEMFDDADGWVLRDGNTGNTRDWIFRDWIHDNYIICDIRGCDTASSSNTGVNIFPSEARKPVGDGSSAHYNDSPAINLLGSSESYTIDDWVIIATDKTVHFMSHVAYSSYKKQYINESHGWKTVAFGHFKGHGANVETAFVAGESFYQPYSALDHMIFATTPTKPNYLQRTPDGDIGDGTIPFDCDCDKVAVHKVGVGIITASSPLYSGLHKRNSMPSMASIDDPIITADIWVTHNRIAVGKLAGVKHVNAYGLPPLSQGNVSTLADGKEYAIFRLGGQTYADGACVLFNLSDDWDS